MKEPVVGVELLFVKENNPNFLKEFKVENLRKSLASNRPIFMNVAQSHTLPLSQVCGELRK